MEWVFKEPRRQPLRELRWAWEQRPSARRQELVRPWQRRRPGLRVLAAKLPRQSERPVPEPVSLPKEIELQGLVEGQSPASVIEGLDGFPG
jgi:hypothetical protein